MSIGAFCVRLRYTMLCYPKHNRVLNPTSRTVCLAINFGCKCMSVAHTRVFVYSNCFVCKNVYEKPNIYLGNFGWNRPSEVWSSKLKNIYETKSEKLLFLHRRDTKDKMQMLFILFFCFVLLLKKIIRNEKNNWFAKIIYIILYCYVRVFLKR